jgi:hypothetical protein
VVETVASSGVRARVRLLQEEGWSIVAIHQTGGAASMRDIYAECR